MATHDRIESLLRKAEQRSTEVDKERERQRIAGENLSEVRRIKESLERLNSISDPEKWEDELRFIGELMTGRSWELLLPGLEKDVHAKWKGCIDMDAVNLAVEFFRLACDATMPRGTIAEYRRRVRHIDIADAMQSSFCVLRDGDPPWTPDMSVAELVVILDGYLTDDKIRRRLNNGDWQRTPVWTDKTCKSGRYRSSDPIEQREVLRCIRSAKKPI